jgi:hypothetical protein
MIYSVKNSELAMVQEILTILTSSDNGTMRLMDHALPPGSGG